MYESFKRIPDSSNSPDEDQKDVLLSADFLLFSERFKTAVKKINEEISLKDPKVSSVVQAILNKKVLQDLNKTLGNKLSELIDKSDELIESPDAELPELKKLRKLIAKETEEVLKMQEELRPSLVGIDQMNNLIYSADSETLNEANELIDKMMKEVDFLINPNKGLN